MHICKEPGCNKSFSARSRLKLHMARTHNPKDFKCEYERCNKAYGSAEILRTHVYNFHCQLKMNCPSKGCKYESNVKSIKNMHKHLGVRQYQQLENAVKLHF